ncbi:YceI family protein [uncultured Roseibium sp.]|uniref:YceI family protein n=1 Tax=uncultured Roseibium sp. TaxID=1936171 RepID=UPI0032174468
MHLKHHAIAVLALFATAFAQPAFAETWTVDKDKSSLSFEVAQGDETVTGSFGTWDATIDFDPAAPEQARIKATIETGSASTGSAQFDGMLPGPDFFDAAGFPEAVFQTEKVTALGDDAYRAEGTLTIRDISQPVTLDFTLTITGDTAVADGTASVSRTAHKVGAGVGTDTLADAVKVKLDLTATR